MIGEWAARVTVAAIVLVWAVTTLVLPFVVKGYTPPPEVGTVMGIVAGGAVAVIFARPKNGNGKSDKKGDDA